MKIIVEIECTPAETRQFLGFPDLQPMQSAVMADLEKRIMREIGRFSPDALLMNWTTSMPEHTERLWKLFGEAFGVLGVPAKPLQSDNGTNNL